jgi:GWxTD domain-containing protein
VLPTWRRALPTIPFLVALAAGSGGLGTGAWALDLPPLRSERSPFFTADLAMSLDRDQKPGLSLSITVPYAELEWVRLRQDGAERFAAGVEFAVVFESRRDGAQRGDAWERRLVVPGYANTRGRNAVVLERRTFSVPPGPCRVRIVVGDVNSKLESRASTSFDVPDYARLPVGFADLELGMADSSGGFRPVPTRRFGADPGNIAARTSLFDRRPGSWPRRYALQYRIRDEDGQVMISGTQEVTLSSSGETALIRPAEGDLFLGSYVFQVELAEGKSRWRVERSFDVEESGPPRGREFERMLEPLSYIATPQEMDWLRSLTPDQQARGWDEFWRRRDPTPDTPINEMQVEFFRRVRYAAHHFQGFGPGWRSDMGRIYIKFGPPDQIENRPSSANSPQIEIWYYNQPYRRYVFGDREGFGRFTLLNPSSE